MNEKIDRSISSLPRDLERPKVIKASATDIPAFYINLTVRDERPAPAQDELHPVSERFAALSRFASQVITKRIEQLPEVAMVDMSGSVASEILIIPDETKLRQAGITIAAVESALKRADVTLGSLTIRDGEYQYSVKFSPVLADREDIERIFLKINGRLFRVRDLAQVIEHPRKRQGTVLSDGRDAITLAVVKQSDARMSQLKSELDKLLGQFRHDYPDVEFTVTRDQTELLDYSISNLVSNIVAGALLACLIILFFMRDMKSPLLVILTIPVTLIVSVLVFYVLGISINIISLSGLVLGIGMMVDNSIIVIDNMTARWLRGERLADAVTRGTNEVVAPMLSSVLTTCAVFIPLIFINGMAGALFYDQAMAVTITLFVAYGVSITLLPVYYRWWYRRQEAFRPTPWLERFSFDRVTAWYETALKWFFRRRALMWGIYAVSIVGLVLLFLTVEKERLPRMTYSDMLVHIDWNDRISAEENGRRTQRLIDRLGERIEQSTVMAGVQQFILSHTEENGVAEATVYLKCRDAADVEPVQREIRSYLAANTPEALCSFGVSGNVFDLIFAEREAVLTARLRSTTGQNADPERLQRLLDRIREALPGLEVPQAAMQEDILYVAQPERMALYGVTYGDLIATLRNALNEKYALHDLDRRRIAARGRRQQPPEPRRAAGKHLHPHRRGRNSGRHSDAPDHGHATRSTSSQAQKAITTRSTCHPRRGIPRSCRDQAVRSRGRRLRGELQRQLLLQPRHGRAARRRAGRRAAAALLHPGGAVRIAGPAMDHPVGNRHRPVRGDPRAPALRRVAQPDVDDRPDRRLRHRHQRLDPQDRHDQHPAPQRPPLKRAILEAGQRRLKAIVMTSLTTILAVAPFLARGDMGSDLQFPMSLVIISGMTVGTLVSVLFIPLAYYEIHKPRR